MSLPPIVFSPPIWTNQDIVLFHGTIDSFAPNILKAVDVTKGKPDKDFGVGFYTTTILAQALKWAAQIAATKSGSTAAVIQFSVSREELARLQVLAFVNGDDRADDYWSFVHHCRRGATDHGRPNAGYYDAVYGPVSAFWNQSVFMPNADQISFHTKTAESVLNKSARKLII
jgi:uncharacterized protein DUF3990